MGGKRVLIVEDHEAFRTLLCRLLAHRGWVVSEAGTVAEAMALLDLPPDCMTLDLLLPDGRGEGVLRRVREAGLPTRVVIVTPVVPAESREEIRELGPDAVLMTPWSAEELVAACEGGTIGDGGGFAGGRRSEGEVQE